MAIKMSWKKLAERFNSLIIRERLLLVAAAVAAIYMLFDLLGLSPAHKQIDSLTASIATQKKQLDSLKAEEVVLTKVLTNDPNLRLKKELEELNSHLVALDQEIAKLSAGLVPVLQLSVMLQDVLRLTDKLQIQTLNTLPPEKINLNPTLSATAGQATPGTATTAPAAAAKPNPTADLTIPELQLYRQGVKLVVQGEYFQLLDYVKQLEATAWRFYWQSLHYQVVQYPLAQAEIQVYTLSVNSGSESPLKTAEVVP